MDRTEPPSAPGGVGRGPGIVLSAIGLILLGGMGFFVLEGLGVLEPERVTGTAAPTPPVTPRGPAAASAAPANPSVAEDRAPAAAERGIGDPVVEATTEAEPIGGSSILPEAPERPGIAVHEEKPADDRAVVDVFAGGPILGDIQRRPEDAAGSDANAGRVGSLADLQRLRQQMQATAQRDPDLPRPEPATEAQAAGRALAWTAMDIGIEGSAFTSPPGGVPDQAATAAAEVGEISADPAPSQAAEVGVAAAPGSHEVSVLSVDGAEADAAGEATATEAADPPGAFAEAVADLSTATSPQTDARLAAAGGAGAPDPMLIGIDVPAGAASEPATGAEVEAAPDPEADAGPDAGPGGIVGRRVAYLVDTSGTMIDSMPRLHRWLIEATGRLGPDDGFTIALFNGETLSGPPGRGGLAADAANIAAIPRWLAAEADASRVYGRSDPQPAIDAAVRSGATQWVLLSDDNFGRRIGPGQSDLSLPALRAALPETLERLDTVQFFYEDDRGLLRRLAEAAGGSFQFVREAAVSTAPSLLP